ncbi:Transposase [Cordylochernes scorpioides]|uniref:Transposase n=1 Tax=Cordylochernes scorpioides TaxID=51811 RepID=A0ABY6KNK3_9ARAC|nr:Transposase [Cordylochernes scorpioides]
MIKERLNKSQDAYLGLLAYRTTPLKNGFSTSELLMGRKLRTHLPTHPDLKPILFEIRKFDVGDQVWVRDLKVPGTIIGRADQPRSYLVKSPKGQLRRNKIHLAPNYKHKVSRECEENIPEVTKVDLPESSERDPSSCEVEQQDPSSCEVELQQDSQGLQVELQGPTLQGLAEWRCWQKWVNNGRLQRQDGSGRSRATTKREDRAIVRMAVAAPESTLSTIQRVTGTQVSKVTINRRLREWNLRARRPLRCLPLTPVHRQVRLQWCRERSTWNCADWGRIVFSDESRFLLCPDDRRKHVWRRPGQRVDPSLTVEHHTGPQQGGMVWGAISFESRNPLVVIPGTLTTQRSPDLSPIEHIRDVMGRRLQPSPNVDYLARQLETSWEEIPQHTIRNLYQSMTRRVAACIQASGGPTTY